MRNRLCLEKCLNKLYEKVDFRIEYNIIEILTDLKATMTKIYENPLRF